MRPLTLSILFTFFLSSCTFQKRHYQRGFYRAPGSFVKLNSGKNNKLSFHKKKQEEIFSTGNQVSKTGSVKVLKQKREVLQEEMIETKSGDILMSKKSMVRDSLKEAREKNIHKQPIADDPDRNNVARAGFRMAIYALFLLGGAWYSFFNLSLFYVALGLFMLTFIFALVAFITSTSAGKDRVNTNRKGLRYSRFGLIVSFLILAAIAVFFIYTPISI